MKYEILYHDFLIQLRKRIRQNSKLVVRLVDILSLERMSVYRRLRQEVPFTFEEIATIAKEFNISLDSILRVDARPTFPLHFQPQDDENLIEVDYLILEEYLQSIKDVASDSDSEISSTVNLLPQPFYAGFKYIFQFYYFKWLYYTILTIKTKSYHEIILPDRLIQIVDDIFVSFINIKTNYIILDNRIFQNFVNDVVYFNNIRLIRDEDILLIKNELFRFLDYMETIAVNGYIDTPSNKVLIYISETSIDTSYSCVYSKSSFNFISIWPFIFSGILSYDEDMLNMMKRRICSIIKTSNLISVTGEKQRTDYFETQRKIVEQL